MIKRRELLRYGGASLIAAVGAIAIANFQTLKAQTNEALTVQWLGHTCFLFTGNSLRILVNPFQALGCTAGYRLPKVNADVVLISSFLLDEGAAEELPGNPQVLSEPGDYEINGVKIQGISIPHDREGGRRFGTNIAWRWTQEGINILHMGGAAAPIELEQKILIGSPDLAIIPVGGGAKAYNPQEAFRTMKSLKPKVVIPAHYLTQAADKSTCDLVSVEEFLALTKDLQVRRLDSDTIAIRPGDLPPEGTVVRVLDYNF